MKFPAEGAYQELVIISDFDGVISLSNVLEALYAEFSRVNWRYYVSMWEKNEISTLEEIQLCLGGIKVNRGEMETFISEIKIDESLRNMYDFCRQKDHYLAILSDGLLWYIEYLLQRISISHIPMFANQIQFSEQGLSFSFPWYDESTPSIGTSKPSIIRQIQDRGYKVLFIGDGLSDIEASKVADIVFAKDYLLEWMNIKNRDVNEFVGFDDLVMRLTDPERGKF